MANIASVLKSEIARIARKEIRADSESLKKAAATHRREIAELKRRAQELEQSLRRLGKSAPGVARVKTEESAKGFRFSAKGLASHRKRLGLSADDCGRLLGASGQSVYNWEAGKAKPRANHLPAIAALRSVGKKQVEVVLASLKGE